MKRLLPALAFLVSLSPLSAADTVFLVDDDGGKHAEKKYTRWFQEAQIPYLLWDADAKGTPPLENMAQYKTVFWFSSLLSKEEKECIKQYLDNRQMKRGMMLTGEALAKSNREGFNDWRQFLGWYLNARYIKTETAPRVGVNDRSDVFLGADLYHLFRGYARTKDYSFTLQKGADIIKPNDYDYRHVLLPYKEVRKQSSREGIAVANNKKYFKTVFLSFDLARENSWAIEEPEFIAACINWLQK